MKALENLLYQLIKRGGRDGGASLVAIGNHQVITIGATVKTFTLPFHPEAECVLVTTESADVRYWFDGATPTPVDGHILATNEERVWDIDMAATMKMVAVSGTAKWSVTQMRRKPAMPAPTA